MPAAYAHYQFGCDCVETLPDDLRESCLAHWDVFCFGVHGPDIFFYYHPLKPNRIVRFGQELHHHSGEEFFTHCAAVYRQEPAGIKKDAMTAYLLGFLAHFALDAGCHGYINTLPGTVGVSHNYAESQYEAYCMKKDGKNPVKVRRQDLMKPGSGVAEIIAGFFGPCEDSTGEGGTGANGSADSAGVTGKRSTRIFENGFSGISEEEILKTIEGQRDTMHLLWSPLGVKRTVLQFLIKLLGIKGGFGDLFIDGKDDPRCEETNRVIAGLEEQALGRYPVLAANLMQFLKGDGELEEYFKHNFEGD